MILKLIDIIFPNFFNPPFLPSMERDFFCITFLNNQVIYFIFFCLSQVIFKKVTHISHMRNLPPSIYTHQLMVTYMPEWVLKTECQKLLNKCLLFVYVLISMLLLCFPLQYYYFIICSSYFLVVDCVRNFYWHVTGCCSQGLSFSQC